VVKSGDLWTNGDSDKSVARRGQTGLVKSGDLRANGDGDKNVASRG
jgi:hypothetical protein